jgi:hypothetical protein
MTVSPDSLPDSTNIPDDLIYGLIDMELKPDTVGGTVRVTIYLGNPAPVGYVWNKYGPNDGWYDYSDDAEFNADRDQVTLTLVDGGIGDDDGVANGVIVDPSGLGSAPKSYTPGGGGGCFIATAASGSNMDRHVEMTRINPLFFPLAVSLFVGGIVFTLLDNSSILIDFYLTTLK